MELANMFFLLLVRFFAFRFVKAGDIAPRGGNFGGSTLAAVPFLGMKFCVVLVMFCVAI